MFSQNDEERVILDYFGDTVAHLTDIGANDGITFSNSRALIGRGWTADLVEPSPAALLRLQANYQDHPSVTIHPYAIGPQSGSMTLHESDSHHGDNVALLSTLKVSEIGRWKGTQVFTPVEVQVKQWNDTGLQPGKFITIDAEGMDYEILRQIPLTDVDLICIEHNMNDRVQAKVKSYCSAYGLHFIYRTAENLILGR